MDIVEDKFEHTREVEGRRRRMGHHVVEALMFLRRILDTVPCAFVRLTCVDVGELAVVTGAPIVAVVVDSASTVGIGATVVYRYILHRLGNHTASQLQEDVSQDEGDSGTSEGATHGSGQYIRTRCVQGLL